MYQIRDVHYVRRPSPVSIERGNFNWTVAYYAKKHTFEAHRYWLGGVTRILFTLETIG